MSSVSGNISPTTVTDNSPMTTMTTTPLEKAKTLDFGKIIGDHQISQQNLAVNSALQSCQGSLLTMTVIVILLCYCLCLCTSIFFFFFF